MSRKDRAPRRERGAKPGRPASPAPPPRPVEPLALRHPAALAAVLVAAACVLVTVTFQLNEPDVWQHLRVGEVIWSTHSIPRLQIWCWPTYGEPQVLPSWGFRALLWPFWKLGGVTGLFVWRWITTLAAFGLLWATSRRMGARGLAPLVAIVLCALAYKQRSQVRPETLVAVLIALEVWILETRRHGGPDRSWWLVAIACVWANVHISYYLGLALIGIHALGAGRAGVSSGAGARRSSIRLWLVLLAAVAASFLNPFGWRALWQPFEYFLFWRHEPIFLGIAELRPVWWQYNVRNGLPLLLAATLLLALWRGRRRGFDVVEAMTLLLFGAIGLSTQRFIGFLALAALPYLARDLDDWVRTRRWPAWSAAPATRAILAGCACVALGIPEWTNPFYRPGIGVEWNRDPVAACDFVLAHDITGHAFNPFPFGGYMLWRFGPDRDRLPFMDIHQTGTREDRRLAAGAFTSRDAYAALMARHPFDWALVDRRTPATYPQLDFFDQDSTWALVLADDAAALYVRREPRFEGVIRDFAYRAWPAGWGSINGVARRLQGDSTYRALARAELERQVASSRENSTAHNFLANMDLVEGHDAEAARHLAAALQVNPNLPRGHERLAQIALRAGDSNRARSEYRLELRAHPDNREAREALQGIEGRSP